MSQPSVRETESRDTVPAAWPHDPTAASRGISQRRWPEGTSQRGNGHLPGRAKSLDQSRTVRGRKSLGRGGGPVATARRGSPRASQVHTENAAIPPQGQESLPATTSS